MGDWTNTTAIPTTNFDGTGDDPDLARVDLKNMADDVSTMKAAAPSQTERGPIEIATAAEVRTGTDDTRALSPLSHVGIHGRGVLAGLDGANQSITNNTPTNINFNLESYDTDSIHNISTNNDRFIPPSWCSVIKIYAQVEFASNATGQRYIVVTKNSLAFPGHPWLSIPPNASDTTVLNISSGPLVVVGGTDILRVVVFQSSGSSLLIGGHNTDFQTWCSMEIIK